MIILQLIEVEEMKAITRKSEVSVLLDQCIAQYRAKGLRACVKETHQLILVRKVKFPLLEFCGHTFFRELASQEHLEFCDQIEALKTEGGNVILGIILQNRLTDNFTTSIEKAAEYISRADAWYVCDIIGERVFGYSLLHEPKKTIPELKRLSGHDSAWVIRSLGAGVHYAVKKGLSKKEVKKVFPILLSKANVNVNDKEIKQGIGWAAKTTAKFHPDIIEEFKSKIQDQETVANWFRAKIEIGLNRNKYRAGSDHIIQN